MPDYGLFIAGPLIYETLGESHLTGLYSVVVTLSTFGHTAYEVPHMYRARLRAGQVPIPPHFSIVRFACYSLVHT